MIGYVEGRVLARRERWAIVLTPGGVGYELELPDPVAAALPPQGGQVCLFVHTVVREDALELFGFATLDDRETFRTLIGITKLGPRTALAILSRFTTEDLLRIVATGDADALVRVPGIGKKSAQRIFIELTYKLEGKGPVSAGPHPAIGGGVLADVIAGLTNLGYPDADASRVAGAVLEAEPDLDVAQALRQALKRLASEKS
ncbi:Holliday junction DNA helicase RuvA [Solidesulfovibrio carbinoliphilus subsp. oakridgensis]|uniref:Holliday junction branch migration complex subunit RuvA n=1 Tax=Solidesulfovibrio carbinoliphilus subsp. oakridgensis TaxID=694327 RepID=G7Q7D8_9BACT|nr:Holliday junction branch migration protein RuvA [Solidesulfovibrio carbinoliphilus]EHJ49649.1 Holliday junction DNA helicase RuvA [Solidesulfovibrio carbinoliphilus subsp. oakridgensis]